MESAINYPCAVSESPREFTLSDTRRLSYSVFGDSSIAKPVFYFHGLPGSRLEAAAFADTARKLGLSIISVSRPGMGYSDFMEHRRILDWPADVRELCAHLNIERFAVVGVSGGSPYAFACGTALQERVKSISIVSGIYPPAKFTDTSGMALFYRLLFSTARACPPLAIALAALNCEVLIRSPETALLAMRRALNRTDRQLLSDAANVSLFKKNAAECFHKGKRGALYDFSLYFKEWGFEVNSYRGPVRIWHGTNDAILPDQMGRKINAELPGSELKLFPGEGHFMVLRRQEEIFSAALT